MEHKKIAKEREPAQRISDDILAAARKPFFRGGWRKAFLSKDRLIDDLLAARNEIEAGRGRLRALYQGFKDAPIGIYITDANGKIIEVNDRQINDFANGKGSKYWGRNVPASLHPDIESYVPLMNFFTKGVKFGPLVFAGTSVGGTMTAVRMTGIPVLDRDGKLEFGIIFTEKLGEISDDGVEELFVRKLISSIPKELILASVGAIESKDRYTRGHSERVDDYAAPLAKMLGLSPEDERRLMYACWLHDYGKVGVPGSILQKKESLSADETEIMKMHPVEGARLIGNISLLKNVADPIRHHHERWDGAGYPAGLAGEDIPLLSRIIAVADAFDAMTSDRPYRAALSADDALAELERVAGTQLDPMLVGYFKRTPKDELEAITQRYR